jgi:hypothetical protein
MTNAEKCFNSLFVSLLNDEKAFIRALPFPEVTSYYLSRPDEEVNRIEKYVMLAQLIPKFPESNENFLKFKQIIVKNMKEKYLNLLISKLQKEKLITPNYFLH